MNVAFRLNNPAQEKDFLDRAKREGFTGLEGHRSLGGLRVSLYNAIGLESATDLAQFITQQAQL